MRPVWVVSMYIGLAPNNSISGTYPAYTGEGINTSSPCSRIPLNVVSNASLAPFVIRISSVSNEALKQFYNIVQRFFSILVTQHYENKM